MDKVTDFAKERLWPMVSRWGQGRLTGADFPAADDALIGCYHYDVQWDFLQLVFSSESSGMDTSSDTYWGPLGPDGKKAPRSVLAFLGLAARLRLAADPATPLDKLDLMAGDWEQAVRDTVFATGRMPADDPRSRLKNLTNAETHELLDAQLAAQYEKWRHTEHEHDYCLYPDSDVRECSKCGIEYEPYDHPHDWFEWEGDDECRICGTVRAKQSIPPAVSPEARLDLLTTLEAKAPEEGDLVAVLNLAAIADLRGDDDEASKWRQKAATAILSTGTQIDVGLSAMQAGDVAGAVRVYEQAAKIGHLPSTLTLAGLLMESGELEEAARWLQMYAQVGNADAMYSLGLISERQNDIDQAVSWHTKAALAGAEPAAFRLGILHLELGNFDEMIGWFTQAADGGRRDAMFNLGYQYRNRGDLERAIPWYTKAADAGDDDAMVALAGYYLDRVDVERAMHWLRKATAAGNTEAAGSLAALTAPGVQESLSGPGLQDVVAGTLAQQRGDLDEAIRSYTMAAEAGNGEAMFQLVLVYRHQGNLDQCFEWLGKAVEAGNADAIALLRSFSAGN